MSADNNKVDNVGFLYCKIHKDVRKKFSNKEFKEEREGIRRN